VHACLCMPIMTTVLKRLDSAYGLIALAPKKLRSSGNRPGSIASALLKDSVLLFIDKPSGQAQALIRLKLPQQLRKIVGFKRNVPIESRYEFKFQSLHAFVARGKCASLRPKTVLVICFEPV
jgi:hypothetical protein